MLKEKHFYEFGDCRVEPDERIVLRDGRRLALTGKAFDLLVILLKHHGELVRKSELISELWPDVNVGEENNLNVQMSAIRKAIGDRHVETVSKAGYRFTTPVVERTDALGADSATVVPKSNRLIWLLAALLFFVVSGGLYLVFHRAVRGSQPLEATALYERAVEYERVGDDEQALAALDQALALNPRYELACVRAAFLAYDLGQEQEANGYLARCGATEASDEALRLKAQGLAEALGDNSSRALETYQLLIDRYPKDTDALYRFADLATDKDRLDEAEKALQQCLSVETDDRYCRLQLMYVKIKQNRFEDVLSQARTLPANLRDYPWFEEPVGVALFGKGQLDDAKRVFGRLSESQQRLHGTAYFTAAKEWLADLLLYQGRVKEATRRIEQIAGTSANAQSRAGSLAYLAQIYLLTGDHTQARRFADQTASVAAAEPPALVQAALVLASLGDSPGVQRLLKLHSDMTHNPLSTKNDHLIRGVLAVAQGDARGGVDEIRLAKDLDPRDEEATFQLATAYFQAGDYESALKMFQAVNELRGAVLLDDVPLLLPLSKYWIAQCYERLGSWDPARSSYVELAALWSGADEDLRRRFLKEEGGKPSRKRPTKGFPAKSEERSD